MKIALLLFSLLLFCSSVEAKIPVLPLSELVARPDIICIAVCSSKEKITAEADKAVYVKNRLKVLKLLKGANPVDGQLVIMTREQRREDRLVIPASGKMILFLKERPDGTYTTVNSIQGLWPLDGDEPQRMGLGITLQDVEREIRLQGQH